MYVCTMWWPLVALPLASQWLGVPRGDLGLYWQSERSTSTYHLLRYQQLTLLYYIQLHLSSVQIADYLSLYEC